MTWTLIGSALGHILSSQWTALTILVILFIFFGRGWIQSRSSVKALIEVQNLRINEANARGDDFRDAYNAELEKNKVLAAQVDKLLVVGDTVNQLLTKLPAPAPQEGTKL